MRSARFASPSLSISLRSIRLDGFDAQSQLIGGRLIGVTLGNDCQHLSLTRAECIDCARAEASRDELTLAVVSVCATACSASTNMRPSWTARIALISSVSAALLTT